MVLKLACRDLGVDCPYVAHGETIEQVMAEGARHVKEAHGYTDEQLINPEIKEKIRAVIKQE